MHWYWYRGGHISEGLGWLRSALDLVPDAAPQVRARALLGVAGLSYLSGNGPEALAATTQAQAAAMAAGDQISLINSLVFQGHFQSLLDQLPDALAAATRAERRARRLGVP